MICRRTLLGSGLALGASVLGGRAAAAEEPLRLRAAPSRAQLAPNGYPETPVWAYDNKIPGPEIRLRQGTRVVRRLVNELPQPTSIHWHGVRIDNAMDGVPGLTQDAVPPGAEFDYEFTVPDAGTFWYHTHNRSWEQLARGLAGPLIVEETTSPDVDAELTLFVSDWRLDQSAALTEDFGAMHDQSHQGRIGNMLTVNGAFDRATPVRRHQRLRIRLINAATDRVIYLGLAGLEGWVLALDGMPLEAPQPAGNFVLSPAQRVDLFVDVTAESGDEGVLVQYERGSGYALASFPVTDGSRARRPAPVALPLNAMPDLRVAPTRSVDFRMEGGAMRGLPNGAVFEGQKLSMRDLMLAGQFWATNGVAGMPDSPLFILHQGEAVRLPLVNDTAFPHAIHAHGHHFREIGEDALGPWRDTILVDPGETREIALVGDNPGNWLIHCHMLNHQAAGMKTWFQVS